MARRAFVVNETRREQVRHLAGVGVRQDHIATIIGCAPKTLRKRFRDDLDRGAAEAIATVAGYLFANAKAGNVTAQIFILKTRAHWRERPTLDEPTPAAETQSNAEILLLVVSAFAPVDRRGFGHPASRSGGLQDAERYRGSAHVLPTPRCRGNTLAHAGPAAQEVSELVVAAAIPPRRSSALQSKHRSTSALDAAVILLESVVQIATCPMPHMAAEFCPDCPGIGIVAIRGDPIRVTPVTAFADRKKAWAATRSRCSLSITSTKAPVRSIARYRYRQPPRTRMYVSSTYQLRPTLPFRRRRRFSANAGVSLASQSRTAS
jgi:hypothetical protein